jgi:UDP-N-acetyl-D-galactosamine dehydrogenase
MLKDGKQVKGAKALMLGITFKENCPDIRNTRAIDIYHELRSFGMEVDVYDPWADPDEVNTEYVIRIFSDYPAHYGYGAILLAVAHDRFSSVPILDYKLAGAVIYDVKGIWPKELVSARL